MFAGGGQENLKGQPTNSALSLPTVTKTSTTANRRSPSLSPAKKVVWLVLDSYLSFVEDKTEWNGTKVVFEIAKKGNKTEVLFTHVGLAHQVECFKACSDAWGFYVTGSLRNLIATGTGEPNKKEKKERQTVTQ